MQPFGNRREEPVFSHRAARLRSGPTLRGRGTALAGQLGPQRHGLRDNSLEAGPAPEQITDLTHDLSAWLTSAVGPADLFSPCGTGTPGRRDRPLSRIPPIRSQEVAGWQNGGLFSLAKDSVHASVSPWATTMHDREAGNFRICRDWGGLAVGWQSACTRAAAAARTAVAASRQLSPDPGLTSGPGCPQG
jgi:hypothetical protein